MNLSTSSNIEKLDGRNYEGWRLHMRSILICNELWPYASGSLKKPTEGTNITDWENKDAKALALIFLGVKENQLSHIKKAKSAHEAWNALEQVHSSKGPTRKVMLYRQLFLMKKGQEQPMSEYLKAFQDKADELEECGLTIPQELISIMLLNSLPEEYDGFRTAMETRDNIPDIEILKVKLIEDAMRRQSNENETNYQSALISGENQRPYRCKENFRNDKMLGNRRQRSKQSDPRRQRFEGKCFSCGKKGHRANECRLKEKNSRKDFAMISALNAELLKDDEWCLDSGASAHMCHNEESFVEWHDKSRLKIQTAGNEIIEAFGSGTVILNIIDKYVGVERVKLQNVIFAPKLKHNLISVSRVTQNGYNVMFDNNRALINQKDGKLVFRAVRKGKIYIVKARTEISMFVSEVKRENLIKWHQRFGHLNFNDMKHLVRDNLVNGLDIDPKQKRVKCLLCCRAKISQLPYHAAETRDEEILETIHSDICGPINTKSLGGAQYFATFIDGKSRFIEVAFLKHRSEVFDAFVKFKNFVENETGRKIKKLRSDNAKEYVSRKFSDFLQQHGIRRQLSVEYTPQQNGVAERANRTLMDMARCMLLESPHLPKSLWAEAINTAAFIRNRCPSNALKNKTPFEVWTGRKPNAKFLRKFGCKAIALEKGSKRHKLEPKGKEYTFVGYSSESKAYRLWESNTKTVIKRRDVIFFETVNPKDYLTVELTSKESKEENNDTLKMYEDYNILEADEDCIRINSKQDSEPEEENDRELETPRAHIRQEEEEGDDAARATQLTEHNENSTEESELTEHNEISTEESEPAEDNEDGETIVQKPKIGRPRILRTGKKGRPRKLRFEKVNIVLASSNYPSSFEDAMNRNDRANWIDAMRVELKSLEKNDTWELVDRPKDKNILNNRWVFSIKYKDDGSIDRYKARLVVKGCEQKSGIDYDEVFAPVARYETVRILFALCAELKMHLHQMDVTTAYVQGELHDEIYMEFPKQPESQNPGRKVCKLRKPLYGLKQAGRQWHIKLDGFLKSLGMEGITSDPCLYMKKEDDRLIIIVIYVDDILLASNNLLLLEDIKGKLKEKFDMKDLGTANNILGITLKREEPTGKVEICQKKFIDKLLIKFKMESAKAVATPIDISHQLSKEQSPSSLEEMENMKSKPYRELVGALIYLSNTTRPDISFAANSLSRYCNNPGKAHWTAAKRVLRYLKGTAHYKITYEKCNMDPICYVDSDWGSDPNDRKSHSGYVVFLAGAPISWKSKKQKCVALSTMEAEYIALSEAVKEIVHLRKMFAEIGLSDFIMGATTIFCDNQSAIQLSKDSVHHERSKHVDIRYHFTRDVQSREEVIVQYIPTEKMTADILTKGLDKTKHQKCSKLLGINN